MNISGEVNWETRLRCEKYTSYDPRPPRILYKVLGLGRCALNSWNGLCHYHPIFIITFYYILYPWYVWLCLIIYFWITVIGPYLWYFIFCIHFILLNHIILPLDLFGSWDIMRWNIWHGLFSETHRGATIGSTIYT